MSVLLDTGFLFALYNTRDGLHGRALEIAKAISAGKHGRGYYTDYVIDELLTLTWVRTRRSDLVRHLHREMLTSSGKPPGSLVYVGDEAFRSAALLHHRLHERLSFTDCSNLAVAREMSIQSVASFDDGFDGHLTRLH